MKRIPWCGWIDWDVELQEELLASPTTRRDATRSRNCNLKLKLEIPVQLSGMFSYDPSDGEENIGGFLINKELYSWRQYCFILDSHERLFSLSGLLFHLMRSCGGTSYRMISDGKELSICVSGLQEKIRDTNRFLDSIVQKLTKWVEEQIAA